MERDTTIGWLMSIALTTTAAAWGTVDPWLKVLFLLSLLDIAAGTIRAYGSAHFTFAEAYKGVQRKVMMAILVTATVIVQLYIADSIGYMAPLTTAVAGFYASVELLSIIRHASAMGIGVPKVLLEFGSRLEAATSAPRETLPVLTPEQEALKRRVEAMDPDAQAALAKVLAAQAEGKLHSAQGK